MDASVGINALVSFLVIILSDNLVLLRLIVGGDNLIIAITRIDLVEPRVGCNVLDRVGFESARNLHDNESGAALEF